MNKNKIMLILLLIFFFISIGNVSATDNNETVLSQNNEITVNEGDSIQVAIDNATAGSTIIVESGNYAEDLVISKELSIIGQNANLNSQKTAFTILSTANNTSISGFNIFVSDMINGTGILVNSSGCTISDNKISGGSIGISAPPHIVINESDINASIIEVVNNLKIIGNDISDVSGAGISIMVYNPVVSRNNVTNIINRRENGTASGILVNGTGITSDDLKVIVTDNYIANIKSINASAYGLDVRAAAVFDNLTEFDVSNNVVEDVSAPIESYGVNIDVFSLSSTLPTIDVHDLNISQISTGNYENASLTGLRVSVVTLDQNESSGAVVHDINIKDLTALGANSAITGIVGSGVGWADIYVSKNNLTNFKSSGSITGIKGESINYNNFEGFVDVSSNNITNLNSPKTKGINAFSLGNVAINKNLLYNLPGENTTFITGVPLSINTKKYNMTIPDNSTIEEIIELLKSIFNNSDFSITGNLSVFGNNIEGTGVETGFLVVVPSAVIHYNRATNLKDNVIKESTRQLLLESYGYDPNLSNEELAYLMTISQPGAENYTEEEIRNMSASLAQFLDMFFGNLENLTSGDVDARYNWWGTNSRPSDSGFRNNKGTILYDPWLILRVNSNPSVIDYGEYSKITADVYMDSLGMDHSADASLYFSGPKITFFTDKGSFYGYDSITVNWNEGQAITYLYGDEYGLATVCAVDYDKSCTTVLIRGGDSPSEEKDNIITMKPA
ncbi:hypothetical protein, partial [Methanobrevibacter sp.]|uniref:hypothetical protein n=1 Tax=Methanobrevibacter sp. TaxID=66852 RepID=UPI00388DED10